MHGSNFLQVWLRLLDLLAMVALITMAFGLMLGIVKPNDALRRIAAILGIVFVLMLIPGMFVIAWLGMSLWEQIVLVAIAIVVLQSLRPRRQVRKRKIE